MKSRVLLFDDYPSVACLLPRMLEKKGFDVDCAGSAEEALARIETHQYQVIVAEMEVQHICVLPVLRTLRRIQPQARFVILTAHDREGYKEEAARLGVDAYWEKPITCDALSAGLRALLANTGEMCIIKVVCDEPLTSHHESRKAGICYGHYPRTSAGRIAPDYGSGPSPGYRLAGFRSGH